MEAPALDGGGSARRSALALPTIIGICHSTLALPGISGADAPNATQSWHCQGFLADSAHSPLSSGTANDYWHLPPKAGTARDFWRDGGFFWHRQGFLARMPQTPLKAGTARDFWYAVGRVDHAVEKPSPCAPILAIDGVAAYTPQRTFRRGLWQAPARERTRWMKN